MPTSPRSFPLAGFALALSLSAPLLAAPVTVQLVELHPTVLFLNREPLCQVGWLDVVNNGRAPISGEWVVKVDGIPGEAQQVSLPLGTSQQTVLVPDLAKDAEVEVDLRVDGAVAAALHRHWVPQRKWTVDVVKSSHEDIGYENFLWVKQKEIAEFMDFGARLSTPGSAAVEAGARVPGGYHYTLETLLFPRYYMDERSETAWRALANSAVKTGHLPLEGAPNDVHSHWMDYEELARTAYPGRREYKDRFGLDLDTILIVDNPSMSWSACQAWADAGYKYAVRFGQPFRTGGNNDYATTHVPAVFWWLAPDGRSRILYTWRNHYGLNFWFGQAPSGYTDLTDLAAINVQRELMAVQSGEKLGPYPYDALLIPSYSDHEIPSWDNRALLRWNAVYRYPAIRIAGPRDFMVYIEKKYGAQLPVLRGDLNNFSADYATIDPEGQRWKRTAARELPLAEGLGVVAETLNPAFSLSPAEVERAYTRMFDFDEHSWPTSPPIRDVHLFNAQWGKHLEARRAWEDAERLLGQSVGSLAGQIATGADRALVVFNPLAHPRTDTVAFSADVPRVVDLESGATVPVQRNESGGAVFVASDVPAFGYKLYRLGPAAGAPAAMPKSLRAEGSQLENEFYTLTFDSESGAVRSIFDRQLRRDLVDPGAPYQFNQLVWDSKTGRESVAGKDYAPRSGATLHARSGPVFAEMVSTLTDAELGGATIVQTIRLYAGLKRIDVTDELSHLGVLHSARTADRYRNNIFYAFPIKVDGFTARAEYPGGVVRPFDDQLRWGSHDYLSANRWVDVSNREFGVTMGLGNAQIVEFGAIRYNEFSVNYKPTSSYLYSYAWSNRMDGLLAISANDVNARFTYSFTSHAGDWDAGATTRFGWSQASPLLARMLPAGQSGLLGDSAASFLAVDAPDVQMTVLKDSNQPGRGWIVRLIETEGRPSDAVLNVSRLPVDAASACDLVENDLHPLEFKSGKVSVSLSPFGFATVRIYARQGVAGLDGLNAAAVSDEAVELAWPAVSGAVGYNIFRSMDPAEPPTAYTWVGRATEAGFVDHGLNLASTYYYRVAALAGGNRQGDPSSPVAIQTLAENRSPPQPVSELGVVRFGKSRLMVVWHKDPEPDVARYLVFRSLLRDFDPAAARPVAAVSPGGYYLEHFTDEGLSPGTPYYYQVLAEDWAGNRQTHSTTATATTPSPEP